MDEIDATRGNGFETAHHAEDIRAAAIEHGGQGVMTATGSCNAALQGLEQSEVVSILRMIRGGRIGTVGIRPACTLPFLAHLTARLQLQTLIDVLTNCPPKRGLTR